MVTFIKTAVQESYTAKQQNKRRQQQKNHPGANKRIPKRDKKTTYYITEQPLS